MRDAPLTPLVAADVTLRGMVLALLLLAAALLLRERPTHPAARLGLALLLGLVVQALGASPWVEQALPRALEAPLVAVSVANAPLFWLFVRALFDDNFRPRRRHALIWLAAALLGGLNCTGALGPGTPLGQLSQGLQRAVPLLAAVASTWAALHHWRGDVVEGRRRLRLFIVVAGVGYTLVMAGVRIGAPPGRLDPVQSAVDALLMLVLVGGVCGGLLRLQASEVFPLRSRDAAGTGPWPAPAAALPEAEPCTPAPSTPSARADPDDAADAPLALALQGLMDEAHAYRDERLSLATLAARLGAPEYRLRRVIHHRLGHRNFSAYVNGLRLAEARARLADPGQRDVPVLSIALEVGFGSIGPFNRAFKADTGLTPSAWRRERLADS